MSGRHSAVVIFAILLLFVTQCLVHASIVPQDQAILAVGTLNHNSALEPGIEGILRRYHVESTDKAEQVLSRAQVSIKFL